MKLAVAAAVLLAIGLALFLTQPDEAVSPTTPVADPGKTAENDPPPLPTPTGKLAITGTARARDGTPGAGVLLRAHFVVEETKNSIAIVTQGVEALCAPDGRFVVNGLAPGRYQLKAEPSPDFMPDGRCVVDAGNETATVWVRRTPRLTVVDPQGQPVGGATVEFMEKTADSLLIHAQLGTDARGEILLLELLESPSRPSRWEVRIRPPDRRTDLTEAVLTDWRVEETRVQLPEGFSLSGLVRDTTGAPAPHAQVSHFDSKLEMWNLFPVEADGSFRLDRLSSRKVQLRAAPDPWCFGPSDVAIDGVLKGYTVFHVGAGDAHLTVPAGKVLRLRLVSKAKREWPEVRISLNGKRVRSGQPDQQGRILFAGLPDESLEVGIELDRELELSLVTVRPGGEEIEIDVH